MWKSIPAAAFVVAAFFGSVAAEVATAAEIRPAVVYGLGGKFDRSFNEAAYEGAERFRRETGVEYREFEIQTDAQREQALRNFARKGFSPIVAIGFSQAPALTRVAREFPQVRFAIVDTTVDLPNVRSVVFREQEGSWMVGVLAAMASKTGRIGFVGGMDIPLIRRFACGYVGGARSVSPSIEVLQAMTGSTAAAWSDPVRGGELARDQIDRGADVVFHAAGGTGLGVLQAVADAGRLGIGVDGNQNRLHPGHVLTSMTKSVDKAVYETFAAARDDRWKTGTFVFGLKEGGVGWTLDDDNRALITPAMKAAVDEAAEKIRSGALVVHDYAADGTCPY